MKLTFLGTSAGESYPAIWCECKNCTYARKHGGKNIRMNTGTMLDDDVLLDLNAVGFHTAARLGVSLCPVRTLLCTHAHSDHLDPETLYWRRMTDGADTADSEQRRSMISPHFTPLPMMTIYGNAYVEEKLMGACPEVLDGSANAQAQFKRIEEGVRTEAENGLFFTPVRARHVKPGYTHSYIIERNGQTLLYALDTAGFDDDMMPLILAHKYDAVVMEGTFGLSHVDNNGGHMTANKNVAFRNLLLEHGCIAGDTPFYLTHLCPHWTPPYDLYAPMMAEKGFIVAYDGMVAEF